ncbi:hypothetical protein IJJ36_01905 [Candidatus Saccharibacteria bacterium]|nr:hypothetical protein [Candidatus Saccharibacteria bacterium]
MPIVGVFAEPTVVNDGSRSDSITAEIKNGCTIVDDAADKNVAIVVAPGNTAESSATSSITVSCNTTGWSISAIGANTASGVTAVNKLSYYDGENTQEIGSADSFVDGTSNWAFKVAGLSNPSAATVTPAYNGYKQVPTSATAIVTAGTKASTSVNTQYKVYASLNQAPGTYTGKVTYTVSHTEGE